MWDLCLSVCRLVYDAVAERMRNRDSFLRIPCWRAAIIWSASIKFGKIIKNYGQISPYEALHVFLPAS